MKKKSTPDPYQLLFPIGILHGLMGGAIWILHVYFQTAYPGAQHAQHMFTGFMLSFAAGFLLTAIPKFVGSKPCSSLELGIATTLALSALVFHTALIAFLMLVFITWFAVQRFFGRTYPPPPHFLFLPIGISMGLIGSFLIFMSDQNWVSQDLGAHGRVLLYYGTMLAFIVGIGAKLITALLGWTALPTHQIGSFQVKKETFNWKVYGPPIFQAFLFTLSFVIEIYRYPVAGRTLRALVVSLIAFKYWRIQRMPKEAGKLPVWIWISAWLLLVGLWFHALLPQYGVHAAHIFFAGGYGLMILMISSRVTLAHGGFDLEIEKKSPVFMIIGLLTIAAMLTRVTAIVTTNYFNHLAYAGAVWVAALLVWSVFFLPKIFFRSKS